MHRLLIILMAVSLVSPWLCKSYAADKVTQETKGDQSPAIHAPGGKVTVQYIYNEINPKFTSKQFEQELEHAPVDIRGKIKDLFYAGVDATEEGRYPDAIELFNNSIKVYPTVSAYIKLGYCYMRSTMYGKAEEAFSSALELSEQRDLKPFQEVLNNEILKQLVFYYQPVVEEIRREKGNFVLFGFFETEGQWYIVFSASWPDWDKDKVFGYFCSKTINNRRIMSIPTWTAMIQPMDPTENFIKDVLKVLENTEETKGRAIRYGTARSPLGPIKRGYIIIPKQIVLVMTLPSTEPSPSSHAPKVNVH